MTLKTIPLLGQIFLLNALRMKPLPLAKGTFTEHHFPKGALPTITIGRLFRVIDYLAVGHVLLIEDFSFRNTAGNQGREQFAGKHTTTVR
jgi:hypothetical protein